MVLRARCGDFHLTEGEKPCARTGGWQAPTPEWAEEIIIDPRTGDCIGERSVLTSGENRGRVDGFSSVSTGIADRIGVRPAR